MMSSAPTPSCSNLKHLLLFLLAFFFSYFPLSSSSSSSSSLGGPSNDSHSVPPSSFPSFRSLLLPDSNHHRRFSVYPSKFPPHSDQLNEAVVFLTGVLNSQTTAHTFPSLQYVCHKTFRPGFVYLPSSLLSSSKGHRSTASHDVGEGASSSEAAESFNYRFQGADWDSRACCADASGSQFTGKCRQSPINIVHSQSVEGTTLQNLVFKYNTQLTDYSVINNGHAIQIDGSASSASSAIGGVIVDGIRYICRQFHFHSPSEHTFDSTVTNPALRSLEGLLAAKAALQADASYKRRALEMHLVHTPADPGLANAGAVVLSITFSQSLSPSSFLSDLFAIPGFPPEPHQSMISTKAWPSLSVNTALPFDEAASIHFYRYDGSLTTPPLTEGIKWFVCQQPIGATAEQLETLRRPLHFPGTKGNYRMIQNSKFTDNNHEQVYRVTGRESLTPLI